MNTRELAVGPLLLPVLQHVYHGGLLRPCWPRRHGGCPVDNATDDIHGLYIWSPVLCVFPHYSVHTLPSRACTWLSPVGYSHHNKPF